MTDTPYPDLDPARVSHFLKLGLSGPGRPIDGLLDRLGETDGPAYFLSLVESSPAAMLGSPKALWVDGKATLEQLIEIKNLSKDQFKAGSTRDAEWAGMLGYFLSIAAALLHHRAMIFSRTREELDPLLIDLATVTPSPWTEMLSRAAASPKTHG